MKRLLTVLSMVALSATAAGAADIPKASAASAAPPHSAATIMPHLVPTKPIVPKVVFLKYKVAPADEYFGRLKLSILGIRNTIKDMGYKVDADPVHGMQIMNAVSLTEDAMHDWQKKYPQDSWIPGAILSLERLYAKVDSDEARTHAKVTMVWLVKDYPKSKPGKIGKTELAANIVGIKPTPAPEAATVAGEGQSSVK